MVIPKTRTENLLIVVLNKIEHEPRVFVDFVKILEEEPSQREQAKELVLCYEGECMIFRLVRSTISIYIIIYMVAYCFLKQN